MRVPGTRHGHRNGLRPRNDYANDPTQGLRCSRSRARVAHGAKRYGHPVLAVPCSSVFFREIRVVPNQPGGTAVDFGGGACLRAITRSTVCGMIERQKLSQRAAIVTGSERGIGKEIALELARHGCRIAVNYPGSPEVAEHTAAEIRALGVDAVHGQGGCRHRRRGPPDGGRRRRAFRPARHPRQQRRRADMDAAPRRHRGGVGLRHSHQPQGLLSLHPGGGAADEESGRRRRS